MKKVCIITTVHSISDPRIFYKEARTLVKAGYNVVLIAQHNKNEMIEGVKIVGLPYCKSRFKRIFFLARKAYRLALKQNADVYHFHDPELLSWMARLKKKTGKNVIYDIHENYITAIKQKHYIPSIIRNFISLIFNLIEKFYSKNFTQILAEKYYIKRFPNGITILNYPILSNFKRGNNLINILKGDFKVLYTGTISEDRGALIQANLVNLNPLLYVYMIGKSHEKIINKIYTTVSKERIHIKWNNFFVSYKKILDYYNNNWLAALAIFPFSEHYYQKEITKLFEYMWAGIPIIASNFPVWENIIKKNKCGICVNPSDQSEIKRAINYLIENPEEAREMGENGKRAVIEKYNWEKESKKLLKIYDELV